MLAILPGSNKSQLKLPERVVLLLGTFDAVAKAQALVLDRVFQDQLVSRQVPQELAQEDSALETSVKPMLDVTAKFIVPSRASGVLIGHRGENIRDLHNRSGMCSSAKCSFG
jgi:hypothetical protein